MAGEVVVDALPYIDHGYDDSGVRESALAMVEEECRRYRPTKNYLDHLPPLNTNAFETKLMTQEFERIQNRLPMETLSMKRYELPPPNAGKLSEISAWQEAIENSKAQLEHQWVRAMNLELMLEYGIEAWKAHLEVFAALQAKAQMQLQHLKKEIQDVNWQRKQAQTLAGEKLKTLEANWVLLVSKNYEIEQQCAEMEKQIYKVKVRLEQLEQEQEQQEEEAQETDQENGELQPQLQAPPQDMVAQDADMQPAEDEMQPEEEAMLAQQEDMQPEEVDAEPEEVNARPEEVNVQPEEVDAEREEVDAQPKEEVAQPEVEEEVQQLEEQDANSQEDAQMQLEPNDVAERNGDAIEEQ